MATQEAIKCSYYCEKYIPLHPFEDKLYYKQGFCYRWVEGCEECACDGDETKCDLYSEKGKPNLCPCCNGKAELKIFRDGNKTYCFVECTMCKLATSVCSTQSEAIQKWNRRVGK